MSAAGFFQDIASSLGGKGELRLIVQPTMAILFGIRLGISDAREGRTPFVLRVFTAGGGNVRLALRDIIVPFCIAIAVDAILQHATLGYVRPVAALVVGILLVWLPFAAARAFTNRIARAIRRRRVA
jgi:hypothetical protein